MSENDSAISSERGRYLTSAEKVKLSSEGRCVFEPSDDSSNLGGVGGLGGDAEDCAQEESR